MISDRMIAMTKSGSAIRAMFEEGMRLAAIHGSENVFDFSLGNPNFPAPAALNRAVAQVLEDTDPTVVHGYMPNAGFPAVRTAVAQNLNARFGTDFAADNILMTVGAAGGLNVILNVLLNPGDEVVVIAPYFLEYGNYVRNFGGVLRIVQAEAGTFQIDPAAVAAACNEKTKAVIVNNPNNPTGVIYPAGTIRALAEALEVRQRELGTSIYILSDEPYRELAYDGTDVPYIPCFYRNTVVGYSWSKSMSLPGERIGYLVIPSGLDDYDLIWDAACTSNRILGFVNAPSLMQLAVARCLNEKTDIDAYDRNRQALYNGLTGLGFDCVYPRGAFYLWMKTPGDEKAFVDAARRHCLLLVPGSSFAMPGYVRLAYCVSSERIARSMPAFAQLAEEFGLRK